MARPRIDRFDLDFLVRFALARGFALPFAPEGDFFRAMPVGCL